MVKVADAFVEIRPDTRGFQSEAERGIAGPLKGIAAAAGAAFAVDKVFDFTKAAVGAASDLAESTSKVEVVFGRARDQIFEFGETSATSVGLAKQEALEAAGTFGNLFTALGLSKDAAAAMAPEIVQLGADLASFNNLGVPETLEKLRSGLVGEVEPLRSLGISFDAATVQAKALEMGLATATGEVDEAGKVQARLKLIMEQSTSAQGDFARTSDGLANQQRTLSAEWKNMQAAIGEALLPTMLELVDLGRERLIPFIERAAMTSLPAFGAAFRAGVPLAESLLTTFEAGLPVLETFAGIIESVPTPVLTLVTSIAALRGALGPLPGLLKNVSGAGGLAGLLTPMNTTIAGLGLLVVAINQHNEAREAERQRVIDVSEALVDNTATLRDNLAAQIQVRTEAVDGADTLSRFGISFADFAEAAAGGVEGLRAFTDAKLAAFEADPDAAAELISTMAKVADEIERASEVALNTIVVNQDLSQTMVDQALAASASADGQTSYTAALDLVQEAIRAAGGELNRFQTATDLASGATGELIPVFQTATDEADLFKQAIEELLDPMLAQENASITAQEAVIEFTEALKEGRREGESTEEFMLRMARSTNDLISEQIDAATSSRDLADRLITLRERFPEVTGKVDAMVARMQFAGQEVGPAGRMIAQAFIDGIVNGLRDGQGRVTQSADSVARIIEDTVSRRLEVESPSKVAIRIGQEFVEGLAIGLEGAEIVDSALSRLGSAFDSFAGSVRGLPGVTDALADITPETTLHGFLLGAQETQNNSAAFLADIDRLIAAGADDLAAAFLEQGIDAAGLARQAVDAIATGELAAFEGWFERLENQTFDLSKRSSELMIEQFDESGRQGGLALGSGIMAGFAEIEQLVIEDAYRLAAGVRQAVAAAVKPDAIFSIPERGMALGHGDFGIPERGAALHLVVDLQKDGQTKRVFDGAAPPSGQRVRALVRSA